MLPLLTDPGAHGGDPADAFDVVVPDMPGFGHSDRPVGAPLDAVAVAGLFAELMTVAGYPAFGVAGGDIGSSVSRYLALDRTTGRLLGGQVLGRHGAEIAKRVDTYATAISYGATVADIADLDLSYTPPLSSPWDAVQTATAAWTRTVGS
ncbi:alpha/beta fold hydrolase [Actinoplanes sp. NPDC000266]